MKKILLALGALLMFSCSPKKIEEVASFEFDNAWYWIVQYEDGTTDAEVSEFVKKWSNPTQTSFFYIYDKNIDLSVFKKERFTLNRLRNVVYENKPQHGIYKMPMDTVYYDDAYWLIEQAVKAKM